MGRVEKWRDWRLREWEKEEWENVEALIATLGCCFHERINGLVYF